MGFFLCQVEAGNKCDVSRWRCEISRDLTADESCAVRACVRVCVVSYVTSGHVMGVTIVTWYD